MTNGSVHPQYDDVRKALKKLRIGPGIPDAERLKAREEKAEAILELPVVRQIIRAGRTEFVAAYEAIALCIGKLDPAQQLAAGVALAINATLPDAPQLLTLPTVGRRREALCGRWKEFLSTVGPKNVDRLRRSFEGPAFDRLTQVLLDSSAHSLGVKPSPGFAGNGGEHRLLVIGGVVNDITFKIADFPEHETSNEASSCRTTPGGKGFMQAIAAAHLGLDVTLLAAIGKDQDRALIQQQLTSNHVHTRLRVISDENGSSTGIFERPRSDSQAVNFRGPAALTTSDIDEIASELGTFDVVLATFEIPRLVMAHLLTTLSNLEGRQPKVIITPAQPYSTKKLDRLLLKSIDYLVARRWEFLRLFPDGHRHANDDLYENLLDLDVGHVCLMNDDGSTVYSNTGIEGRKSPYVLPGATNLPSSAISRDAFCAALAWHLMEHPDAAVTQAVMWAAAAMALAAATYASRVAADDDPYATLNSLPNREEVAKRVSREPRYQIVHIER